MCSPKNAGNENKKKETPLVGFEPTTFELEVQHASPLRHIALLAGLAFISPQKLMLKLFCHMPLLCTRKSREQPKVFL